MSSKIYVGNLPYSVTDVSLQSNFAEFGGVSSAKVMMDRETGRSKGFGFVEMANAEVAQAAINGLHGMSVDGRSIVVNLARPREERSDAGGYTASTAATVGAAEATRTLFTRAGFIDDDGTTTDCLAVQAIDCGLRFGI